MCTCNFQNSVPASVQMYILTFWADRSGGTYACMHHVFYPWSPGSWIHVSSAHHIIYSYMCIFQLWSLLHLSGYWLPSYVLPADPLLIFQNYCFPLFSLLRSSLQQCYNTHCCNVWKENFQHLRSVLQSAVYLHLLLLLPSPDSSYIPR